MLLFVILLALLFIGPTLLKESFTDASGSDLVTVSMKDLLSLLGASSQNKPSVIHSEMPRESLPIHGKGGEVASTESTGSLDEQFYKSIKGEFLQEVRTTLKDELKKKEEGSVLSDSCIDSIANQQGTQWMKYVQGKNPDDYIRKDSIPCYGCSLA